VKSLRTYGAALAAGIMLASLLQSHAAQAGAKIPSTVPALGLLLEENFELTSMPSVVITMNDDDSSKSLICSSVDDPLCTEAKRVMIIQHLPACVEDASFACISDIWAIDATGKKTVGNYVASLPNKSAYDRGPIDSMELAAVRGTGALWNIPGVVNSGGEDNYFVSSRNNIWLDKAVGTPLRNVKAGYYSNISAAITPVQKLTGEYRPNKATDKRDGGVAWGSNGVSQTPTKERCAVTDTGICQVTRDFPSGYRFGLTLKISDKLSGWFHGRIALPSISTKPWNKGVELSVEAEPVKISTLNFTVPNAQIPEAVRKIIFTDKEFGVSGGADSSIQTMGGLSDPDTMELMNAFLPAIGDKGSKTTGYWSFSALNAWNQPAIQKCSDGTGDLAGVVTTNALTYSAGPPTYNKESGALEYKVASPHFEASGAEASGSYDLVLKSDVARCIYGFSKAPIKAEISISSQDGQKKVATTVVNESNGWLYLSAKGFTFSSPVIQVKLTQEAPAPAPTPTPTPTPIATQAPAPVESAAPAPTLKPVMAKKIAITCVKGKLVKKVSAVNPKCPAGYKKK
jgi:hypothetical protein